ncbi:hypothetical protein Tco_0589429 [Tanacetum coccineum]
MKISSFMDSVKSPELAKRFASNVPKTVEEMMKRLDEFLPPSRPVANPLRTGDPDKYCDYHQDKGHHTNDCIQLRKQLEIALESGKLNHLMKDLRQRVERRQNRNPPAPKVINMVDVHSSKKKKRKDRETTESWMNTPISFPLIMTDDASDEPLIIEAEIEGYLVRRVYVDKVSSVEVMFEHCFENLPKKVKVELRETRTDLVGFAGEVAKPLGKIDLEVCFGNERPEEIACYPVNYSFNDQISNPKGIATLIARTTTIAECRLREEKQMVGKKRPKCRGCGCYHQLKTLLKDSMEVFAWEPADMPGVPRKIIEHALNVNHSLDLTAKLKRLWVSSTSVSWMPTKGTIKSKWQKRTNKRQPSTWNRERRNLEAYVDDMVIKSKEEKRLLADIAETFESLKTINIEK